MTWFDGWWFVFFKWQIFTIPHKHTHIFVCRSWLSRTRRETNNSHSWSVCVCLAFSVLVFSLHVWICAMRVRRDDLISWDWSYGLLQTIIWVLGTEARFFWKNKCCFQASHQFSPSSMVFWFRLRLIAIWLWQTKGSPVKYCEDVPSTALQIVSAGYAVYIMEDSSKP